MIDLSFTRDWREITMDGNDSSVKKINKFIFIIVSIVAALCFLSSIISDTLSYREKWISSIVLIVLIVFVTCIHFSPISISSRKYIYFLAGMIVEIFVCYFQNGLFDNTYVYFCIIGILAAYSDYKYVGFLTTVIVTTNILMFLLGKKYFFPAFDVGNFLSYIMCLGAVGISVTYTLRSMEKLHIKTMEKENHLQLLLNNMSQVSTTLDDSISHLSGMSKFLFDDNQNIHNKMKEISNDSNIQLKLVSEGINSVEVLNENSNKIKANADVMYNSSLEVLNLSKEGSNIVDNLLNKQIINNESMKKIDFVATQQNHQIKEVSKVLDMIFEISKSIKLFSLNATIESSRASEKGKGFLVIAKEISKLANSTDENAKEIKHIISKLSNSVSNINNEISSAKQVLVEQNKAVEDTKTIFERLKNDIFNSIETIRTVHSQIGSLDIIGKNVEKSMTDITSISDSNNSQTRTVLITLEQQISTMEVIGSNIENITKESKRLKQVGDASL